MPNAQNIETLAQIKEDLDGVTAVWVVDYRGLTVKEIQQLRRNIREADASMKVYKNTLMHRAVEELGLPNIDEVLSGPSAFVFAGADAAASAKVLKEFAKSNKKLEIKGGMMEGQFLDAAQVQAVASLPSKEQLVAQVAGAISGVARGLAVTINGVSSGLARATQAIADQKSAA